MDTHQRLLRSRYRSKLLKSVRSSDLRVEQVKKGKSLVALIEEADRTDLRTTGVLTIPTPRSPARARRAGLFLVEDDEAALSPLHALRRQVEEEAAVAAEEIAAQINQPLPESTPHDASELERFEKDPMSFLPEVARLQLESCRTSAVQALRRMRSPPDMSGPNEVIEDRELREMDMEALFRHTRRRIQKEWRAAHRASVSDDDFTPAEADEVRVRRGTELENCPPKIHPLHRIEQWHRTLMWSQKFTSLDQHVIEEVDTIAQDEVVSGSQKSGRSPRGTPSPRGPSVGAGPSTPARPARSRAQQRRRHRPIFEARPSTGTGSAVGFSFTPARATTVPTGVTRGSSTPELSQYRSPPIRVAPRTPQQTVIIKASMPVGCLLSPAFTATPPTASSRKSASPAWSVSGDDVWNEWGSMYYDGDPLLAHQDVLHGLKPSMFPLQKSQRPLPRLSLKKGVVGD
mmetsp:Transcript_49112/g.106964  ORF Transcript_49112/g.106964 Transcript_49112/m.106964 type:complete len:459 (+) Transcript_49112:57-1433(+)